MKNLPVKAGEGRSGVGTLASPMEADRRIRRGGRGVEWSGDACVAHGGQGRSGRGTGHKATQESPPRMRHDQPGLYSRM